MAPASAFTPKASLTQAPTNLKEAIDWVLRVTGKDGKKNDGTNKCICFFSKAVKDLLYDARSPGSPGPSPDRNWDKILLEEEKDIVKPVLTDLGLVSTESTTSTCDGGTEVIGTLIARLAQGLQKWVGWKEGDECCLRGDVGQGKGIGKRCKSGGGGGTGNSCCTKNGSSERCASHECSQCGITAPGTNPTNCYLSAYNKTTALWTTIVNGISGSAGLPVDPVKAAQDVHLLARIFLGSVCLIWSGLSQLGFLTGTGSDKETRWKDSSLHKIDGTDAGLGSFMAAMGYDLERLNGSGGPGSEKKGEDLWKLLSGKEKDKGVSWQEFTGNSANKESVAEYYSSIYGSAKTAVNGKLKTEQICEQYPLLVLHILASGYFRAGSAGAKGITTPASPAKPAPKKEENPSPRKPRTIREILYWLSALPYSQGYKELVKRMKDKYPRKEDEPDKTVDDIKLYNDKGTSVSTTLCKDKITHYLTAACGYCPLVLIGIQGTIEREVTQPQPSPPGSGPAAAEKCPNNDKKKEEKEDCNNNDELSKKGEVCYGGYHLEVSKFGPLHGMYANGLYGFDLEGSPTQCLDQLRIYVYHCFYQLYFLRKQCKEGVVTAGTSGVVLGWQSCRYGKDVKLSSGAWLCSAISTGAGKDCKCKTNGSSGSPLMAFLCDSVTGLHCPTTYGRTPDRANDPYPEITDHMEAKEDIAPKHLGKAPKQCPVPMGWQSENTLHRSSPGAAQEKANHFKDLNNGSHKKASLTGVRGSAGTQKYPAHCTGNTLSHLLEYYCDPVHCHGSLVVLLRLLACITPTVPRTLGDLFGFYYYVVYIGGKQGGSSEVTKKLKGIEKEAKLGMHSSDYYSVVGSLAKWSGDCKNGKEGHLKCLIDCTKGSGQCSPFLCPLSGQQYGQLSPAMAGTYLSWLVYLIGEFQGGLQSLESAFKGIDCKDDCRTGGAAGAGGCGNGTCTSGTHGDTCTGGSSGQGVCQCPSVVSCTGVLPVLYRYGFGYGDVSKLHPAGGQKRCHNFLGTLESVKDSTEFQKLTNSINQLIYTTRLPWIFVLTLAWLVAILYLAFGAIWPLDWTHMRSHCRGWFRKGSLSPWEVLMVGKKKGRGILEFFGKT